MRAPLQLNVHFVLPLASHDWPSQVDPDLLDDVVRNAGRLDIIIDDGSHLNEHVLTTFHHLFAKLAPGGLYLVEDTQTSYWPGYAGRATISIDRILRWGS